MCGIAGIVGFGGPVSRDLLENMNRRLIHRGPDDGGEWVSETGDVGLANRRLAILDVSPAGHQPMHSPDGRLAIAYNGEIYNYVELRDELASLGERFRSHSDTEVILAAYARWGEACVERFNGMFAFALWDAANGRLFAARDRFGEKPFYYHHSPKRLVFASELKALVLDDEVPRRIDQEALARYLLLARVDGDTRTFFDGVRQLPPAHVLPWTAPARFGPACTGVSGFCTTSPGDADERAVDREFRALLTAPSGCGCGAMCPSGRASAGGLDSSSIVSRWTRCSQEQGRRAGPEDVLRPDSDGRAHRMRAHIDAVGGAHACPRSHDVYDRRGVTSAGSRSLRLYQDEPVAHRVHYAQWKVMELASSSTTYRAARRAGR